MTKAEPGTCNIIGEEVREETDVEGGMAGELLEILVRILPFTLSDIQSQFKVLSRGVT